MTSRELGHGVAVVPCGDLGWRIISRRLTLPWMPRAGDHPGSAVVWLEELYEVVGVEVSGSERSWILQPWPDAQVMRTAFRLDEMWIEERAGADEDQRRQRLLHMVSLPAAPVLALAPARLQRRWRDSWGFPAAAATAVSAIFELAAGCVGVVQLLALTVGAEWYLPDPLRLMVVIGPALSAEAIVRLATAVARAEPLGSVVGLPLALLWPAVPPPQQPSRPLVQLEDVESGVLEIYSEELRRDWVPEGVMRYRGMEYRLTGLESVGTGWRYRFESTDDEATGPALKLAQRPRREQTAGGVRPPSAIRTTVVTAIVCMAPRRYQEWWARHLGVRSVWFTLLGAGAELFGGWVNLEHGATGGRSWTLAMNLFFVVEAVTRLALLVSTGRPVGSILGWALHPLLARMMPGSRDEGMRG